MSKKKKQTDDLVWANEVMEVYRNLGSLPGSRILDTPSAAHLLVWAQRSENETKFIADLVPKATAILSKYGVTEIDDATRLIDSKTVKELRKHLNDALRDCIDDALDDFLG